MNVVKKAVIPAAGYGTRMLPASKAIPKELFPVGGKPVIQHIVEEAVSVGIQEVLIIISKGKEAIQSHFAKDQELESRLEAKNKIELLESVKQLSSLVQIEYVYQKEQKGLGDAILLAETWTNEQPFMVMLGDTIINPISETKNMIDFFDIHHSSLVKVRKVPTESVHRYGIMDGTYISEINAYEVHKWVEKPHVDEAPSNLAVAGRYIFTAEIFEYLKRTEKGVNDEIQLTDAMQSMLSAHKCYAQMLEGKRYDIGNWDEFVEANIDLINKKI